MPLCIQIALKIQNHIQLKANSKTQLHSIPTTSLQSEKEVEILSKRLKNSRNAVEKICKREAKNFYFLHKLI